MIDGPVLVAEALRSGIRLEVVHVEPGADAALVSRLRAGGVPVVEVPEGSLRKVLDLVSPQSVVAVAAQRVSETATLLGSASRAARPLVVLVGIQDPGNAGTLVRVAEAAGCAGVIFTEGSVDPWNPKTVRASAGSLLRVPIVVDLPLASLAPGDCDEDPPGLARMVAGVPRGGTAPEDLDLTGAFVLLIGSEAQGVPEQLVAACDSTVTVPTEGAVESLNAAVSGASILFEAARQRRMVERVGGPGVGLSHDVSEPGSPQERSR